MENNDIANKNIAENIKKRRIELGLSQTALGRKIGVDKTSVSKIETGRSISMNTLYKYSAALNCEPEDLMALSDSVNGERSSDKDDYTTALGRVIAEYVKYHPVAEFVKQSGISKAYTYMLLGGKGSSGKKMELTLSIIERAAKGMGISTGALLSEMGVISGVYEKVNFSSLYTDKEKAIIDSYRKMSDAEKKMAERLMNI